MITVRPSAERGHFRSDWLDSWHTFSFDTFHDPQHMRFRDLRVINEDRVKPGHGFPLHRHENMEVLTVVLSGALRHEDDLGHGAVIGPWEVQRFTAGTGIRHSEFNPSDTDEVHLLQIWIFPDRQDLTPGYQQKRFDPGEFRNRLRPVASPDGRDGSLTVHQDTVIYRAELAERALEYSLAPGRHAWLQVMAGSLTANETELHAGDGAAVSDEPTLRLGAEEDASLLYFDLP